MSARSPSMPAPRVSARDTGHYATGLARLIEGAREAVRLLGTGGELRDDEPVVAAAPTPPPG